jgi:hypothetical protein
MRFPKSLLFATAAFAVVGTAAACGGDGTAPTAAPDQPARLLTNQPPNAVVNVTVLGVAFCTQICFWDHEFDAYQSSDPDGSIVAYKWVLENGYTASTGATMQMTSLRAYDYCGGNQQGKLIVTDNAGAADTACFGYTAPQ